MSLTRRQFVAGALGTGAVAAAGGLTLGRSPIGRLIGATASTTAGGHSRIDPTDAVLVLVTMYGGNDGLNTVVPASDGTYRSLRGPLALPEDKVLALGGGLSLHPSLTGTKKLWDDKLLAIVRGVGYPNPIRSHFRSMDIWQTGVPETSSDTGWLGRWLDATGKDPLRALSTTPTLPLLLLGQKASGAALLPGTAGVPVQGAAADAYRALFTPTGDDSLAGRVDEVGTDLLTVSATLDKALSSTPSLANGGAGSPSLDNGSPGTTATGGAKAAGAAGPGKGAKSAAKAAGSLAGQMDTVARLIRAGVPTRVYSTTLGGFDTHANELDTQARLLSDLDAGLTSLFAGLGDDRRADQVVVVAYSEFGRRVAANGSGGTDHGTAAPVLVAGRPVQAGFHGEEPSLTDLDDGDLKANVDFRSIYGTLLAKVLGVDPAVSLGPNHPALLSFV
jgi:uncharacterized protein (DUF1501 family)